ncbi:MAG TPA: hypothetical protein VF916_02785, partial [Ktedonobacterales bacterium]
MARHAKTQRIIDEAREILAAFHPMTLRQVFYQLVSRQAVENTQGRYDAVGDALVAARKDGSIPWEWIEDRTRGVRGGYDGWERVEVYLDDQIDSLVRRYSAATWPTQPRYVEVWV